MAEVRAAKNKHLLSLTVWCEFTEDSRPFLLTLRNTSVFNQTQIESGKHRVNI